MTEVFAAFGRAVRSQFASRMLWLLLAPFAVAFISWMLTAWLIWDPMMQWLDQSAKHSGYLRPAWEFLSRFGLEPVLPFLFIVLLVFPLVFGTAMALITVIATPVVTRYLGAGEYVDVQRRSNAFDARALGTSVGNSVKSLLIFLIGYVVTMPLWLVPGLILIVPWFWWSWLTSRMLRVDSLMDHASAEERNALIKSNGRQFFALGGLVSLLNYVPPLFIIAPIFGALAFGHYSLAALRRLRGAHPAGVTPARDHPKLSSPSTT